MDVSLTVEVDAPRCASSGNCADVAPTVFTQDDDTGVVVLLEQHPGAEFEAEVRQAEALCPAQAILVRSSSGGTS
jgi:ferredoxin